MLSAFAHQFSESYFLLRPFDRPGEMESSWVPLPSSPENREEENHLNLNIFVLRNLATVAPRLLWCCPPDSQTIVRCLAYPPCREFYDACGFPVDIPLRFSLMREYARHPVEWWGKIRPKTKWVVSRTILRRLRLLFFRRSSRLSSNSALLFFRGLSSIAWLFLFPWPFRTFFTRST